MKDQSNRIIDLENELSELENKMRIAIEKAEEADQLKSAFLANMSHEIRTPLNAILGFSRLLINKEISDIQRREYSEYITNSANNLLHLIRDIIDVSKIEAGKINIEKDVCFVNKILKELKITFEKEKQIKQKDDIELILKMAIHEPKFAIKTDPFRFNQIFINLLGNALKFIESGNIEFGYSMPNQEFLQFYVKDTGIGIPANKSDLIFSRFGQIINKKIKNPAGTGLGLSITKHLIEKLGGEIWFESELNIGTTFYFTLPFDEITIVNSKKGINIKDKLTQFDNSLNILSVEDDQLNMILFVEILSAYTKKIKIDEAKNGYEALDKLNEKDYDLIIMDIRMPELDGYETTKYIREKFKKPKSETPILGLSAHEFNEEIEDGRLSGMNDFLLKPIDAEKLIDKIKKLTQNKTKQIRNMNIETDVITELDTSFFEKLFNNDRSKIKRALLAYYKEIPLLLENLKSSVGNHQFENMKLAAHSMKSTFRYIGQTDMSEIAKNIEHLSTTSKDIRKLKEKINDLVSNWKILEPQIEKFINL